MNNTTLVPASYPALESEVYESLEVQRDTLVPSAQEQMALELECMFPEES